MLMEVVFCLHMDVMVQTKCWKLKW